MIHFPLLWSGPLSGLILGIAFGVVLEGAGFANPETLTGQLRLVDWTVFKVMFTAIIVAAALLYLSRDLGLMKLSNIFIPSLYFWGTLLGGAGVGIGMAVGGYCPGTSAVAMSSGRLDGLVFLLGIGAGTLAFDAVYAGIRSWIYARVGARALTLPQALHLSAWIVVAVLFAMLVAVGWIAHARGGPPGPQSGTDSRDAKTPPAGMQPATHHQ